MAAAARETVEENKTARLALFPSDRPEFCRELTAHDVKGGANIISASFGDCILHTYKGPFSLFIPWSNPSFTVKARGYSTTCLFLFIPLPLQSTICLFIPLLFIPLQFICPRLLYITVDTNNYSLVSRSSRGPSGDLVIVKGVM
eukprot:scaffold518383_cov34-Prasinocladus_malaysianus.AAC.1